MARSGGETVRIEGRDLRLTNLERVLYPATGTTKADVLDYWRRIAPVMLPHCRDRAATRKRWPDGVGERGDGQFFFQKDVGEGAPDWVETRAIQHRDHVNHYPLANDLATLAWFAQLAALEVHVPQWRFAPGSDRALPPDRLVLDLDPGEGVSLRDCAAVARLARDLLHDMGLTTVPVTSGSKGIHLYAALDGSTSSEQASKVARELARALEADHPDTITSVMKKTERAGKVFIDWSQNNASKTTIAPYSLRGRAHPMVAAPRTWGELASPRLKHLDFRDVLRRVAKRGDPMAGLEGEPGGGTAGDDDPEPARDRLTIYRAKRDASRTPEPVPARVDAPRASATAAASPVFVIQRHDARRLHWDFRLEHDGVLVSWALPKGPPTDPGVNHLAVPTENHPMDYRFFEGTIPRGEYGAGAVEIWDAGTFDLEKWRDDEVIATLHGRRGGGLGGSKRFALFRTRDDATRPQWMIHLMQPRAASGADAAAPRTALRPMLASSGSLASFRLLDQHEWAFEMKWDGMRAIVTIDGDLVRVRSRSARDVTVSYPELASIADAVFAESCTLDGELVALDARGVPSFARLQQRMGVTDAREADRLRGSAPVRFVAFDVLEIDGRPTVSLPYRDRRALLAELVDELDDGGASVSAPPAFDGDVDAASATSRELGLEGVLAKRLDSAYRPGERSRDWVKLPLSSTADVVVVGWRPSEADASGLASLLVAVPGPDGALRYAGRVGTGFSAADRRRIRIDLERTARTTPPVGDVPAAEARDSRWVTPRRVAEVRFRGLTGEGRLRHAAWRGWRPDKRVADLAPLEPHPASP